MVVLDAAIIGAGISGLSSRSVLREQGWEIRVFEKSRGTGGRMSTRRGPGWIADIGAQYTSAVDVGWRECLFKQDQNLIKTWVSDDGVYPRYLHREGMSAITRAFLGEVFDDILFQTKVIKLSFEQNFWKIHLDSGGEWLARSLVLTAPVPQSLELLSKSGLVIAGGSSQLLSQVLMYRSCLSLIVESVGSGLISAPALWRNPSAKIAGIFHQQAKGLPGSVPIYVVHASSEFSRDLWDRDLQVAIDQILRATQEVVSLGSDEFLTAKATLHRWRYSEPESPLRQTYFEMEFEGMSRECPPLVLAGDAFGRASVEGAFLSGAAAAKFLGTRLQAMP